MKIVWHRIVEIIAYFAALLIIVAALFVSLSRLATPYLNQHIPEFEKMAEEMVHFPVTIQHIKITWSTYEPVLNFDSVMLLDAKTHKSFFEIPEIKVRISLLKSLWNRRLEFNSLKVAGVHMIVRENAPGQLKVKGFENFVVTDKITGQSQTATAVLGWIFAQPFLLLQDIDIHFYPLHGEEKSVSLNLLELQNSKPNHELKGRAVLNQELPTRLDVNFHWQGDVTDLSTVKAHLYFYLEGVSLPQWFSKHTWRNLRILEGLGSIKLWMVWDKNVFKKIQAAIQFYDLQGQSLVTKKNIIISRVSGNVGWREENGFDVIAGDDLLIDLPYHLWPTESFSLKFQRVANGWPLIKGFHLGYLDLGDMLELINASGILPASYEKWLTTFNPSGEFHDVKALFRDPEKDPTNLAFSGEFANIRINPWNSFPGLQNLHGILEWDGVKGDLKLNSQNSEIYLDKLFAKPLKFDQLAGQVNFEKDKNNSWTLAAKNFRIFNPDLNSSLNLEMNFPQNDSPTINLESDFVISNTKHIDNLVPKNLDRDFIAWLNNAFHGGQVIDGKAVIKGRISDFPFDHDNGTMMVSGLINNLDLHFAPDWPELKNINGKLLFSGRAMTIDLLSGQIASVPIQSLHAEIPYIGDAKPQILSLKSALNGDLSQGLSFIQTSPLKKTLGEDLSGLQLQGPMKLDLNLTIPLRHPKATQVSGSTVITNGVVHFPEWNLTVDKLNGGFSFTDKSISAKKMTGELFAKPMTLAITTQMDKQKHSQVLVDIAGEESITDLQNWLKIPFGTVMSGQTGFTMQLKLPPHDQPATPLQVSLNSNLQGIAMNLPYGFSKKATDKTDFQLAVNLLADEPVKLKFSYAKLLSAALTLEEEKDRWSIYSGELHLGSQGAAEWQTEPGILLSGNFDTIDWNTIAPYVAKAAQLQQPTSSSQTKPLLDASMIRGANFKINTFKFPGMELKQLELKLAKNGNLLTIGLNNPQMSGQIIYPLAGPDKTVTARFQRLSFPASSKAMTTSINPETLPPISFVSENVRVGGAELGRIAFRLVPENRGLAIHEMSVGSSAMNLNASGYWSKSTSNLAGKVSSSDVNRLLQSWGIPASSLVGSTAEAQFNLTWQGAPFQPSLETMSGTLSLKLGKGRVINLSQSTNAQIGFGRMLNVFSLRHLTLDFSDMFENGYSFDSVKGDFTLRNGSAYTQNLQIDGPIASVGMNGRIGFAARNYDLKVGVTAYVTSSLPMVATVATLNPLAGVAAYMMGKLMTSSMSKITSYEYTVTGPWSNPVWAKIGSNNNKRGR